MGTAPSDILTFRARLAARTGVLLSNIGIAPDPAHLEGGGYHCGCQDIKNIGKWGSAGSAQADYSVRQARDRIGGNDSAALDMDDDWPIGGRAAWIRWNNMVVFELMHHPERLGGLRAINFTPDGAVKRRYDSFNSGAGVVSSTDTVLWHTHFEWWRNSIGTREDGFQRLLDLAEDAIANRAARPYGTTSVEDPDMEQTDALSGNTGHSGRTVGDALADVENLRNGLIGAGDYVPSSTTYPAVGSAAYNMIHMADIVAGAVADVDAAAVAAALAADATFMANLSDAIADKLSARLAD